MTCCAIFSLIDFFNGLMGHPVFGVIALPLLSLLYVRKVDIDKLKRRYDWEFRTKHELALDLCRQVMRTLRALASKAVGVAYRMD